MRKNLKNVNVSSTTIVNLSERLKLRFVGNPESFSLQNLDEFLLVSLNTIKALALCAGKEHVKALDEFLECSNCFDVQRTFDKMQGIYGYTFPMKRGKAYLQLCRSVALYEGDLYLPLSIEEKSKMKEMIELETLLVYSPI